MLLAGNTGKIRKRNKTNHQKMTCLNKYYLQFII